MFLSRVSVLGRASSLLKPNLCRKAPVYASVNLRYLSTTAPLRASESPKPFDIEALRNSDIYQKISKSPEAILAIQKLSEVLQKQGVDVTSGTPPSMIQMSKLLMNVEFREASKNLMEEFKKAGIDPNDKAMMEQITSLMKKGGN